MGIQQTDTREVPANQFATEIINESNRMELLIIQRDHKLETLLGHFAADPQNHLAVMSGLIDKLAEIDPRFVEYKR